MDNQALETHPGAGKEEGLSPSFELSGTLSSLSDADSLGGKKVRIVSDKCENGPQVSMSKRLLTQQNQQQQKGRRLTGLPHAPRVKKASLSFLTEKEPDLGLESGAEDFDRPASHIGPPSPLRFSEDIGPDSPGPAGLSQTALTASKRSLLSLRKGEANVNGNSLQELKTVSEAATASPLAPILGSWLEDSSKSASKRRPATSLAGRSTSPSPQVVALYAPQRPEHPTARRPASSVFQLDAERLKEEVWELKTKLSVSTQQNTTLFAQLNRAQAMLKAKEKEINTILSEAINRGADPTGQLQSIRREKALLASVTTKLNHSRQQVAAYEKEIEALKSTDRFARSAEMQAQVLAYQQELEKTRKLLAVTKRSMDPKGKSASEQWEKEVARMETAVRELRVQNEVLTAEKVRNEREIEHLKDSFSKEMRELLLALDSFRSREKAQQSRCEEIEALKQQLLNDKTEVSKLRSKLVVDNDSTLQSRLTQAVARCEELKAYSEQLRESLAESTAKSRVDVDRMRGQVEDGQAKLASALSRQAELESSVLELQLRLQDGEAELSKSKEAADRVERERAAQAEALRAAQGELDQSKAENKALAASAETLKAELECYKSALQNALAAADELKAKHDQAADDSAAHLKRVSEAEARSAAREEQLQAQLATAHSQRQEEIAKQTALVDGLRKDLSDTRSSLQEKADEIERQEAKAKELMASHAQLQHQLSASEERVRLLQEDLKRATADLASAQLSADATKQELSGLLSQAEVRVEALTATQGQVGEEIDRRVRAEAELEQARAAEKTLLETVSSLQVTSEQKALELNRLTELTAVLKSEALDLQYEAQQAHEEKEKARQRVVDLERRADQLQLELAAAEQRAAKAAANPSLQSTTAVQVDIVPSPEELPSSPRIDDQPPPSVAPEIPAMLRSEEAPVHFSESKSPRVEQDSKPNKEEPDLGQSPPDPTADQHAARKIQATFRGYRARKNVNDSGRPAFAREGADLSTGAAESVEPAQAEPITAEPITAEPITAEPITPAHPTELSASSVSEEPDQSPAEEAVADQRPSQLAEDVTPQPQPADEPMPSPSPDNPQESQPMADLPSESESEIPAPDRESAKEPGLPPTAEVDSIQEQEALSSPVIETGPAPTSPVNETDSFPNNSEESAISPIHSAHEALTSPPSPSDALPAKSTELEVDLAPIASATSDPPRESTNAPEADAYADDFETASVPGSISSQSLHGPILGPTASPGTMPTLEENV